MENRERVEGVELTLVGWRRESRKGGTMCGRVENRERESREGGAEFGRVENRESREGGTECCMMENGERVERVAPSVVGWS